MSKLLALISIWMVYHVNCQQKALKLSVYYESLCPDSVRFFRNQLNGTYEKLGAYFHVDFVPYGFGSQVNENGSWAFTCQHGERECKGNKYHACELAQGHPEYTNVKFLNCIMSTSDPSSQKRLERCADEVGIDFKPIEECYGNGKGDELLAHNGLRTNAVNPSVSYIPTLVINDVFSQKVQSDAEFDLMATICEMLDCRPEKCRNVHSIYEFLRY